jgi:hypothetical protein
MYVDRPPIGDAGSRTLEQGDLLKDLPVPALPGAQSFGFRQGNKWVHKLTAAQIGSNDKDLRVMSGLNRLDYAIVLSNSCDNFGGTQPLLVAPVKKFTPPTSAAADLRELLASVADAFLPRCACGALATLSNTEVGTPVCEACAIRDRVDTTPSTHASVIRSVQDAVLTADRRSRQVSAEHWMVISRLATGSNPKKFYLPNDPARGFPRSEVHLSLAQPLDQAFLSRCLQELGTTRLCGLSHEALIHLQYTIDAFFSRNPRDDHSWPSIEDLRLKAAWLEEELSRGTAFDDDYKRELEEIKRRLGAASAE